MSFGKIILFLLVISVFISLTRTGFLYFSNHEVVEQSCVNCFSIEKRQFKINHNGLAIFGHNFIVVRDPSGTVLHEFHGFATRPKDGTIDGIGIDASSQLKFWHFEGEKSHLYKDEQEGAVLYIGEEKDVQKKVNEIILCGEKMNNMNIDYPYLGLTWFRTGYNSNSVTNTLLYCAKLSSPHIGIFTPGEWRNILK